MSLVLRETSLLPHPNPGFAERRVDHRLAAVSPEYGPDVGNHQHWLLAPGAAHDNAPDKVPAKRLRTIEEAGKQSVPFTTGLLIGIGETLEDRVDALLAIRDLHERYGHIQEVIIQNFRVKLDIPMANWPEPSHGRDAAHGSSSSPAYPQYEHSSPAQSLCAYYDDLMDAGINDWGGISPLTPDFINPEKPWPHLDQLRLRTEAKGFILQQRLPVYPEFIPSLDREEGLLSQKLRTAAADDGLARRAA